LRRKSRAPRKGAFGSDESDEAAVMLVPKQTATTQQKKTTLALKPQRPETRAPALDAAPDGVTMPFSVGAQVMALELSEACYLNGRRGIVLQRAERVTVKFSGLAKPKAILPRNLLLVGNVDGTVPQAYEMVLTSPLLDWRSDTLALLCRHAAPPQLAQRPFRPLPESEQMLGGWPPDATARFIALALDACHHSLVIEWRAQVGWRVLQSFDVPGCPYSYSLSAWLRADTQCGSSDAGFHHRTFGQGRILDDFSVAELLRRVAVLKQITSDLTREVLLPQIPVAGVDRAVGEPKEPRLEQSSVAPRVRGWAARVITDAEALGADLQRPTTPDGDVALAVGTEKLLRIPLSRVHLLDAAYRALTGEETCALVYLRAILHTEDDLGWAVKTICWS